MQWVKDATTAVDWRTVGGSEVRRLFELFLEYGFRDSVFKIGYKYQILLRLSLIFRNIMSSYFLTVLRNDEFYQTLDRSLAGQGT